jgi:hypothetical protein
MTRATVIAVTLLGLLAFPEPASAHCDTTRGPVVTSARAALEVGDPNLVLHWVGPEDEAAIRRAFQQTMEVRALSPEAKELADRSFFETLVRVHRAGEGAPYTGLTDDPPEPIIVATDRALERGSLEELEQQLFGAVSAGLAQRFAAAQQAKEFRPGDVAGGREFVAAYVPLTHWAEGVFTTANGKGEAHLTATRHTDEPRATAHQPNHHEDVEGTSRPRSSGPSHSLPWIVAAFLAVAAAVEGVLLFRRRRPAGA